MKPGSVYPANIKEGDFPASMESLKPVQLVCGVGDDEYAHDRWRSFQLGIRSYKSIDRNNQPNHCWEKNRSKTQHNVKDGDQITVSPALYFTINDEITLIGDDWANILPTHTGTGSWPS